VVVLLAVGVDCTHHARPFRVQANEGRRRGGQAALSRHARGSVSFNTVGPAATAESLSGPAFHMKRGG